MDNKKFVIIWLSVVGVLALALISVNYLDKKYIEDNNLNEQAMLEQYGVDISKGEKLLQCADGSYDIYKPQEKLSTLCGELISEETRNYLDGLN